MSADPTAERSVRLANCLDRARSGELGALGDVVSELNPLLWHVARSQGLGREDAADVVQTTWLELVRRLHEIRAPHALTAWLVTATRREAWRVRSRRKREVPDEMDSAEPVEDAVGEPAERFIVDERDRVLWRAVRLLSERCQVLLRIVAHVERPDYSAIAGALDMPRGSIGPTRGRCLAKLRELLSDDPEWSAS